MSLQVNYCESKYGEVLFPSWATKYIMDPEYREKMLQSIQDRERHFVAIESDHAPDGIPWICVILEKLGIPYNVFIPDETNNVHQYCRFTNEGKVILRTTHTSDVKVSAYEIMNMIDRHESLGKIRLHCAELIESNEPLGPPLAHISEQDYLSWVENYADGTIKAAVKKALFI